MQYFWYYLTIEENITFRDWAQFAEVLDFVEFEFSVNPHVNLVIFEQPHQLLRYFRRPILQPQLLRDSHQLLNDLQDLNPKINFPYQKLEMRQTLPDEQIERVVSLL